MKQAKRARTPARARATAIARDGAPVPDPAAERRRSRIAIAVVGLATLALLVLALGPHRVGDYFTETDFYGSYAEGARLIQQGRMDPSRYGVVGPGYEATLALVATVVRDRFLAAELISVFSVAAALWLCFVTARRLTDGRVALAMLLVLATNPFLIRYGYAVTTDALTLAIQTASLAALLLGRGRFAAPGAGALAALAFLTRYNLIALLPAGVAIAALGGTAEPRRMRAALGFAAGFLLPVVPWVVWSLAHGGRFAFQLHHNIAYEVFAHARGIPWDTYQREMQPQFHSLWDVIARDPGAVAGRMVTNLFAHAVSSARSLTGWLVAGAAVAGVAIGWRGGLLRRAWPVWLTAGLIYASLVPVFYSERYALALLPAAALLAGIAFGSPRFAFPLGRVWLKAVAFVLLLAWTTAATVRLQAHTFDQLPVEVLDAARALVPLRSPDDRVIARKGHLAYHAGIEPLPFPFDTTLAGLAEYARANRARWLFFSWPEAQTRPQFFALLDTAAVVPGLTVRAATRPHPAVLYEIGPEFGRTPAWMENDTLHAYHTLRGRLRVDGHDADALYNYAMVLRAMGKYREAMEFAARAEPLMPGRFEPILLRGIAALDSQDPETAERAFTRVLALDPENVPARLGLGWSLSTLGNDAGAARAWRDVVDATGDAATLQRMVEVFEAAGDAAAAARARARLAGAGAR